MGWSYRKSVSFGPLRLNISRNGVGYSVGGRGFRTGVRADGRRYSRYNLPGTGLTYYKSYGSAPSGSAAGGCAIVLGAIGGLLAASLFSLFA